MYSKYIKTHRYPHQFNENGLEPTKNRKGGMHTLTQYSAWFIEGSAHSEKPVLDIGCAYGVATIPCLENGAKVIAVDISDEHLNILRDRTPEHLHDRLTTVKASFPDELNFKDNSISSVLISRVFSFLKPEELIAGLKKIYRWLEPGGMVFAVNHTPYIKLFDSYINEYESKKKNNIPWAGYISNLCMHPKFNEYRLPDWINLMDKDILKNAFHEAGFVIQKLEYFSAGETIPIYDVQLDGRELVGCIAVKECQL